MPPKLPFEMRTWLAASFASCSRTLGDWRARADHLREHRSLELLVWLAAGAFLMGIATRTWRSRSHGH